MSKSSLSREIPFLLREPGTRTWMLDIQPDGEFIPDPRNPLEEEEALWLVAEAMDGCVRRPLTYVYNRVAEWGSLSPDLAITIAVMFARSPFGLEHQYPGRNRLRLVLWRGQLYQRDRGGVLTPTDAPPLPTLRLRYQS